MDISVVLERVENNGFRARCGDPIPAVAEGPTREVALDRLRGVLTERFAGGMEVVSLRFSNPLTPRIWPDDAFTHSWLQGIEEARQAADEQPMEWEKPDVEQS